MNKKEFVEVDEKKCEEVKNCTGVKIVAGKRYCRGCGNVQPDGVPVGATVKIANGGTCGIILTVIN